jgi:hypothetical protein
MTRGITPLAEYFPITITFTTNIIIACFGLYIYITTYNNVVAIIYYIISYKKSNTISMRTLHGLSLV